MSVVLRQCAAIVATIPLVLCVASAGEPTVSEVLPDYTYEAWVGGDATRHSWTVYGGMTSSFKSDIRVDGLRLRSAAGYGAYSYTSPRWNGRTRTPIAFDGVQHYTDLFLGYQLSYGPTIFKGFLGATQERHIIAPFDTENDVQGGKIAFKGALETWTRLGSTAFVQTDSSWSAAFHAYSVRVRTGYRLSPHLSAGLEAAAVGNQTYDSGRFGTFARLEWNFGEISISAGGAGDQGGVTGPYGSFAVLLRF